MSTTTDVHDQDPPPGDETGTQPADEPKPPTLGELLRALATDIP